MPSQDTSSLLHNSLSFSASIFGFSASETGKNPTWVSLKSSSFLICPSKPRNLSRFLCLSTKNRGFTEKSGGVGRGDAVIIVDHGSRRRESKLMLNEFVEMFKHKTRYEIVGPAHMELTEPSIADAFQSCIQKGAYRIIISPFFLLPWRHWSQDIPSLSAEAAKEHPGKLSSSRLFSVDSDLPVLNKLSIGKHAKKAPKLIAVLWSPPLFSMVKCKTDGAAKGCPSLASCGVIFRNSSSTVLGCFCANLGLKNAYQAELIGAILDIETAFMKNWLGFGWKVTQS